MDQRFKTIVYLEEFVDYNQLEKGIYTAIIPYIFDIDETIETLIKKGETVRRFTGDHHVSDIWFENLKLCQLSEISIKLVK